MADSSDIGEGESAEAAKQYFMAVYEALKKLQLKKRNLEEVKFNFAFDIPLFLGYYSDFI